MHDLANLSNRLLVLGVMRFFNLLVFSRIRRLGSRAATARLDADPF